MAPARKKVKKSKVADPISDRARVLSDQIAALESQIKKLDTEIHTAATPKLRSTALPHGATVVRKPAGAGDAALGPRPAESASATRTEVREPVFETVKPVRANDETATPDQFNEFGARKYDLPALLNRLRSLFSRPASSNPRLVTYLAAGGVRGLRPLRYEKRVARNRFIALVIILLVILLGILSIFLRGH
jgi:hypothetical protein